MTKLRNNASVFERRGDPWVSQRDAIRDYRRDPEREDPDMDQYARAVRLSTDDLTSKAQKASIFGRTVAKDVKSKTADLHRRSVNIAVKLNKRLHGTAPVVVKDEGLTIKRSCPECKEPYGSPHKIDCPVRLSLGQQTVGGDL